MGFKKKQMTVLVDYVERRGRQEANRTADFKRWADKEIPSKYQRNAPIYSKSAILIVSAVGYFVPSLWDFSFHPMWIRCKSGYSGDTSG